jgi:serine/threonine protein kinase
MIQFSQYKIISLLGQGGMAKVYLAEHKSLGHTVAIKVLNKEYFHNDTIRKRFLAEARSLARMNHPNIVRVMDLIEENESAAFVMEHIEGHTLRDYLEEKGKLPDDEIRHLFGQMLDAVGYVHEKGLIHRDIKPSNFMLDGRGNIKLLDFGIAKAQDASSAEYTQTGTGVQMGTPMYMSPEQVKSTKEVTAQTDIYSLGVVLYQMVSGNKPYDISTLSDFDLKTKIVNEPLPKTDTGWDELISKSTEKNIKLRFQHCKSLISYPEEFQKTILENNKDSTSRKKSKNQLAAKTKKYQVPINTYIILGLESVIKEWWWASFVPVSLILFGLITGGGWIIGLTITAFIITLFYLLFWTAQFYGLSRVPEGKVLFEDLRYEFDQKQIKIMKRENEGMFMPWENIKNVIKKRDSFTLQLSVVQLIHLPFHIFETESDLRFAEMLFKQKGFLNN